MASAWLDVGLLRLLVALTLGDLISFYIRQFDSIEVALWHVLLLAAVIAYREELRTETLSST